MAGWQKIIKSGSAAQLSNLYVTNSITASAFLGTASLALSASWAPGIDSLGTGFVDGGGGGFIPAGTTAKALTTFDLVYSNDNVALNLAEDSINLLSPTVPDTRVSVLSDRIELIVLGTGGITIGQQSGTSSFILYDDSGLDRGVMYNTNYGPTLRLHDRSIPDVGTIRAYLTASYAATASVSSWSAISVSSSYAISASYAPSSGGGLTGGVANQLVKYTGETTTATSSIRDLNFGVNNIFIFPSGLAINTGSLTAGQEEGLYVFGNTASYNAATIRNDVNNYSQLNIINKSAGANASVDLVATNDTGNEVGNFVDLGINGSGYTTANHVGAANDGYIINTGSKFVIVNATPSTHRSSSIHFAVGGYDSTVNSRMIVSSSGEVYVPGYVRASSFTGSLLGTAATASFVTQVFSRGATIADITNGVQTTGSYYIWRSPFTCQVQSLYGKKSGTGTPQINARKSGSGGYSYHTASNLLLSTADQWATANSIANTTYAAGDSLEIIVTGSGATQIAVQLDFIRI